MKECPYCQAPVEGNALFCRSCGASLRLPEYDRAFCPHCGARVSARQEFCHECHWSLVKAAPASKASGLKLPATRPGKPSPWKNPWVWGGFIGIGLVIALLPWFFVSGPTSPPGTEIPAPKIIEEKPPVSAPAPSVPPRAGGLPAPESGVAPPTESPLSAAVLKKQLEELLNQLREAQLKKDLSQYLQVFSPNFPDLEMRRQKALAVWQAYDYTGLDFEVDEVKLLDADHASAKVTWNLKTQQKTSQTGKIATQVFNVWFSKDGGSWRISKLEMVRKPD